MIAYMPSLQPTIPYLSRSVLHRCYQRYGISRLPDIEGNTPAKKKFKQYLIGYFPIDIAEVKTEEGTLYLFVAIDCTASLRTQSCMQHRRETYPRHSRAI